MGSDSFSSWSLVDRAGWRCWSSFSSSVWRLGSGCEDGGGPSAGCCRSAPMPLSFEATEIAESILCSGSIAICWYSRGPRGCTDVKVYGRQEHKQRLLWWVYGRVNNARHKPLPGASRVTTRTAASAMLHGIVGCPRSTLARFFALPAVFLPLCFVLAFVPQAVTSPSHSNCAWISVLQLQLQCSTGRATSGADWVEIIEWYGSVWRGGFFLSTFLGSGPAKKRSTV